MSKTTPAAAPPAARPVNTELFHMLENWEFNTTPKLALLIKLSEAEAGANELVSGESHLDVLACRGTEMLLRDVLRDMETLLKASGAQRDGFVMLGDDDETGGER